MSKCLKLYISVPLFSSSTYDVQSVCVGFFHHVIVLRTLATLYRHPLCVIPKEKKVPTMAHTHKKKGVVQPDDAAVAYILRLAVHFAYT